MKTIDSVIERLRAEYLEMPGMRLRVEQVQRLCGVEPTICQTVLDTLVNANFLCVKIDGYYARSTEEKPPASPSLKGTPQRQVSRR